MKAYIFFMAGVMAGWFLGLAIQPRPTPSAPATAQVTVTPGDVATAREVCRRHHLAWARLEVSEDQAHFGIVCESEDVVRAQTLQCAAMVRRAAH